MDETVDLRSLEVAPRPDFAGGHGALTPCTGPDGRSLLLKHYHADLLPALEVSSLRRAVGWRRRLTPRDRHQLDATCAWPLAAVTDGGAVAGILIEPAGPAMMQVLQRPGVRPVREPRHLDDLARTPAAAARVGAPHHPPRVKLAVLATLIVTMQWLHDRSYSVGDLQPRNVLFTVDGPPRTLLVDCDACAPLAGAPAWPPAEPELWRYPYSTVHARPSDYHKMAWTVVRCLQEDLEAVALDHRRLERTVGLETLRLLVESCGAGANTAGAWAWRRAANEWLGVSSATCERGGWR
jgi:hypothetical protein